MARFRCYRCPDLRPGRQGQFREFEGDRPECPKCGASGDAVHELVDVHFLVVSKGGPIQGHHGVRCHVACEPRREWLATPAEHYAATADPRAATCPRCRGTPAFREAAGAFRELRGTFGVKDPGCCE